MEIVYLTKDQWLDYTDKAHELCFGETKHSEIERCDYALVAVKDDVPLMYATIKEIDALSAYMQRGGAFPSVKGTASSYKAFELILAYLKQGYPCVTMRVENNNTSMLRFAMKAGFLIDGISYYKNKIFLEHLLENQGV